VPPERKCRVPQEREILVVAGRGSQTTLAREAWLESGGAGFEQTRNEVCHHEYSANMSRPHGDPPRRVAKQLRVSCRRVWRMKTIREWPRRGSDFDSIYTLLSRFVLLRSASALERRRQAIQIDGS